MSSSAQIVQRALKRLRLLQPGETPSAEDAADGLAALNAMIAGWQADGLEVTGDVPLAARFEEGVVALLAVRLAPDYGMDAPGQVLADAQTGLQRLQAAFFTVPTSQFDYALTNSNTQSAPNGCGPVTQWAQKTAKAVADRVQSNGHIYTCTTAGTTGILRPLGTASSIPDGTVVWAFERDL